MKKVKEYLRINRDGIEKSANYIAKSNNVSYEKTLNNIVNDFIKMNGTNHRESVDYNNKEYIVSNLLGEIRNNDTETLRFYVLLENGQALLIEEFSGSQCKLSFDLSSINIAIAKTKLKFYAMTKIPILIIHNHPFLYRASPSRADFVAFESIIRLINLNNKTDIYSKILILDFGIVTPFDYWSYNQAQKVNNI